MTMRKVTALRFSRALGLWLLQLLQLDDSECMDLMRSFRKWSGPMKETQSRETLQQKFLSMGRISIWLSSILCVRGSLWQCMFTSHTVAWITEEMICMDFLNLNTMHIQNTPKVNMPSVTELLCRSKYELKRTAIRLKICHCISNIETLLEFCYVHWASSLIS